MKKIVILSFILITIFIIFVPNVIYAEDNLGLGDLDSYKGTSEDSEKLKEMAGHILGVIQVVGTILSVIILIILGLKYMTGSVEERADYQKTLIPYVIGAGILFTGSYLPQFIYNIVEKL